MEENTTIGKHLQKARQNKDISLDDIITQTKININVLKHLENDELSELPSKTYVRGFVTSYAKAVGLNIDEAREILDHTYNEQFGVPQEQVIEEVTPQIKEENFNKEAEEITETLTSIIKSLINKKAIYSIAALIVVGICVKGISSFFNQLTSESKSIVEVKEKPTKKVKENLLDSKANNQFVAKVQEKSVEKKPEPVVVKEEKKEEVVIKVEEPKKPEVVKEKISLNGKFPFKKFSPTPVNMYDIAETSDEASNPELLPENIKASAISGKQNVYIVAKDDSTWISYRVDDQKIKRYVLRKGRTLLLKGDEILLYMGNFNAAKVFLNNKLVKAQTRTGVKSMVFPEENAKNYELPLFPSFNGIPYSASEYKANMAAEVSTN